ncbi:hypothetical protein [Microbulbifer spongiae]|uniref:Uncharacterized protein n=1 Tax=Microbulbifer spongiae TaxID=2944933 RepID=A0ABY9EEL9_9GAMM|nr:hypothetical protein [Microbulbifer sp. MI-G]WKD49805.1 hypothetical protein M8T91_18260 [Microbulbifer sp. MI-G]
MNFIHIESRQIPVKIASFIIFIRSERVNIQTGDWCDNPMVSVRYDFEIIVDNNSGDDGALAPACSISFLYEEYKDCDVTHLPLEKNTAHYPFEIQNNIADSWEAVLGNDSWELENNRMTVRSFEGNCAQVLWEAEYGDVDNRRIFLFEGSVTFDGILVWANTETDIEAAISQTWNPELLRNRLFQVSKKVDLEQSPAHWEVQYQLRKVIP